MVRFHALDDNPYLYPSDEQESIRLKALHDVVKALYGKNVLVPITKNPTTILDIGAGSGAWTIEVAEEYPTTMVIGLDLAPFQPIEVPEKCQFRVGDFRTVLVEDYDASSVDLIHARFLHAGINEHEWGPLVKNMFHILKPGGWAQCGEVYDYCFENDFVPEGCLLDEYHEWSFKSFALSGTPTIRPERYQLLFEEAGFQDVQIKKKLIDLGDWRGDQKTAKAALTAFTHADIQRILSKKIASYDPNPEQRERWCQRAVEQYHSKQYHISFKMYIISGRKPLVEI